LLLPTISFNFLIFPVVAEGLHSLWTLSKEYIVSCLIRARNKENPDHLIKRYHVAGQEEKKMSLETDAAGYSGWIGVVLLLGQTYGPVYPAGSPGHGISTCSMQDPVTEIVFDT
jgi:hypothetical protein